jgi:hypothetical protein
MEPTLLGPGQAAECRQCQYRWWVSDSTFDPLYPLMCCTCGGQARITTSVRMGQRIPFGSLCDLPEPPPIGSLIVFRDPTAETPEVKRLVGQPGDRVELRRGDIWRNHQRWQKSLLDGLSSAVLVNTWEPRHRDGIQPLSRGPARPRSGWSCDPQSRSHSGAAWWCYQHLRADRQRAGGELVAGAIRAELIANHATSWPDSDARDIGLIIQLAGEPSAFSLGIWTPHGPIGVQIPPALLAPGSRICLWWLDGRPLLGVASIASVQGETPNKSAGDEDVRSSVEDHSRWQLWQWSPITPSAPPPSSGQWIPDAADRRLPAPATSSSTIWPVPTELAAAELPELRSDRPVGFTWKPSTATAQALAIPPIDWAWVIRDLHYTGPNGETDFLVTSGGPNATGLIVLGDNPAIAYDARQRWPGGLPWDAVIGELKLPAAPWRSLESQAESPNLELRGGGTVSR